MPPASSSRAGGPSTAPDRRPTRQGRTTVRPTNYYARTFAGRSSGLEQSPEAAQNPPGFCPALTHFSQAVDAFPKELIRHFSMLKEVEAKIHDPERNLGLVLDEIEKMPVPTRAERRNNPPDAAAVDNGAAAGANGREIRDPAILWQELAAIDPDTLSPQGKANLKRRQAFCRLRMHIANILPALDEKQVVLNGAISTKDKGLARMHNSYAHLDEEVSEEARYGSLNHWAYADKEEKKKGGAQERQRREVVSANNLAAAAQHVHDVDSIAAKSEARREAMLANKRNRHQHVDSDFDDRPVKKPHKRKGITVETAGNDARAIGLGISNNSAQQGKRKKAEKALAAAALPMERSLSSSLKAAGAGGRSGSSPRATPSVESGTGKRKPRAPPAPAQRKNALPAYSPQPASSPLVGNFSLSKTAVANAERPTASRARKNSIANSVASAAQEPPTVVRRPSSSHSAQQPASSNAIAELEQAAGINRDNASTKGTNTPKDTSELPPFESIASSTTLKHEDVESQEPESMEIDIPTPAPVTTRAGRASKTATPIVGTFPEIPMARSRSTRKANNGNGNSNTSSENNSTTTGTVSKRGKKTAATNSATMQSPALEPGQDPKSNPQSSRASSIAPEQESQEAESDEDRDEPRYCYCNQVSFGNMIACDNDNCPREWFHLPCVNLKTAPSGRAKWFCSDECKDAHAKGKAGKSGRPGSSRQ